MFNKKVLAVALAAAFSTNAFAVVDLDATDAALVGNLVVGAEFIDSGDYNADGLLTLTPSATDLDVLVQAGFTISNGTSKYVRFDLTGGEFATVPTLAVEDTDADAGADGTASISDGGNGESYVIFEVLADDAAVAADAAEDIGQATEFTLAANYAMNASSSLAIKYTMYESAQDAIDAGTGLSTANATMVSVANALTGSSATAATEVALVAEDFKKFDDGAGGTKVTADVVALDVADILDTDVTYVFPGDVDQDVVAGDLVVTAATVTFSGDFSFGVWDYNGASWGLNADGDLAIAGGTATINADGSVTVAYAAGDLTVTVDGTDDVAKKGAYTVTLAGVKTQDDAAAATDYAGFSETVSAGAIAYDTTSITIPYLTTFDSYNQRIYIVNNGGAPASYTTTFTTEDGVTATAGNGATGEVPAGEMLMIKATDLVTLDGKTRTSAVIEIEAQASDIEAATQTVNLADSTTDTVILPVQ